MTTSRSTILRRITLFMALLALLALFVAIGHHHNSEQSAQACPICHFPTSMVGIFVVVVITIFLTQTGPLTTQRPRYAFRPVIRWSFVNRAPPLSL